MRYQSAPVIPEERQETTRERAARQRREELRYTASDEKRWKENRERVLRDRQEAGLGQISQGLKTPLVLSESTDPLQTVEPNVIDVNPSNMHWPPYNFLAKEGEKEIHVRYTQDVVETTVLAPEEWQEFFDTLDKTQNIGGAMKGTYDAFDTAKKLGGLGVTAYVKTHNGVDYLILKGYKQHMKTLLAGNRFKASNPQVVKLGLGALDSVKGMARYVKVTTPVEVLVGSAINVLQYVLNDEYTLKQLGIDEAKLLVGVLSSTALAGGILGVLAVASIPVTLLAGTIIIVGSSFAVWAIDKTTDFQNKIVEGAIENFN